MMNSVIKTLLNSMKGLIEGIETFDVKQGKLNILGSQSPFLEMILLIGIREEIKRTGGKGVFVVVLQQISEFKKWKSFLGINFSDDIHIVSLPHMSFWGRDRFVKQTHLHRDRLQALSAMCQKDKFYVVLTTIGGLRQNTLSAKSLGKLSKTLKPNDEWDLGDLLDCFHDLGYREVECVTEPGTFSRRGGIVDVFSLHEELPCRIEFIGDIIGSLKIFDPIEQTSLSSLPHLLVSPAQEFDFTKAKRKKIAQSLYTHALDFQRLEKYERQGAVDSIAEGIKFPGYQLFSPLWTEKISLNCPGNEVNGIVFFIGNIRQHEDSFHQALQSFQSSYERDVDSGKLTLSPQCFFDEKKILLNSNIVEFGNPFDNGFKALFTSDHRPSGASIEWSMKQIQSYSEKQVSVVILAHSKGQLNRVKNVLEGHNISFTAFQENFLTLVFQQREHGVFLGFGDLSKEVFLEALNIFLIPEHTLFGEKRRQPTKSQKTLKEVLNSFRDLTIGSLVVHVEHGIGKYLGMTSMTISGMRSEFLVLEYFGGDKVYLPVDKLGLLQKYSGGNTEQPAIDKLRGQGWLRRKVRVRKAIKEIAEDLIRIHAKRKLAPGKSFSPPNDLYFQLEADFPYDETDDQIRCIEEVNADLSAAHPMDRLVCGDVGFGKTEIAIRASMRVVMDGFQVMILAPTTVLSYQHHNTFRERFQRFGVKIGLLNRFVKGRSIRSTLNSFSSGDIDILIGTHRVLSKDVEPANLGLIIVDEEQRFGVSHKEALKTLRASCDILTLTATPIPRSLHMSMLGLKDISTIMTPPTERLGIKTYVMEWDENTIKEGIEKELLRGGQVFFVHNRVGDILEIRSYLQSILPGLDIRVAHGQMKESDLERVILDFIDQRFSILLCTTIIESGIDMPNVNTIFVNQADKFGLAQLYQMRGRVGRSQRQSYAYFLVKSTSILTPEAEQRLDVLAAHQELGSGFYIANYDLEMRGAGDLLGGSQSGHVSDVGVDMYTQMLEEEIRKQQGKETFDLEYDPEIKISINALLCETYIASQSQRLNIYKRIFSSSSEDKIREIRDEVIDRFGKIPQEAENIFLVAELKLKLKELKVKLLTQHSRSKFEIKFGSLTEKMILRITNVVEKNAQLFVLRPDYSIVVNVIDVGVKSTLENLIRILDTLTEY